MKKQKITQKIVTLKRKILPHPFYATIFFTFWLCLNGWTVSNAIFGFFFSFGINHLLVHLGLEPLRLQHKYLFFKLFYYAIKEALTGHIKMVYFILFNKTSFRQYEPHFITASLNIYDPNALMILNIVMALSPDALLVAYNAKNHNVSIHLLDKTKESDFLASFYNIYQEILAKIFIEQEQKAKYQRISYLEKKGLL